MIRLASRYGQSICAHIVYTNQRFSTVSCQITDVTSNGLSFARGEVGPKNESNRVSGYRQAVAGLMRLSEHGRQALCHLLVGLDRQPRLQY